MPSLEFYYLPRVAGWLGGWVAGWGVFFLTIRLSQPSLAGVRAGAELGKNYKTYNNKQKVQVFSSNKKFQIKMPQSRVGMQGKNTGNMPCAMCALSMNMSLDPTPI